MVQDVIVFVFHHLLSTNRAKRHHERVPRATSPLVRGACPRWPGLLLQYSNEGDIMDETPRDHVCYRRKCLSSHQEYSKPDSIQKALASTAWKEYNHDGRKYWHNTETNTTTWEMPDVLKNAQPAAQLQAPQSLPQPVKAAPYVKSIFYNARYILTTP